MWEVWNGDEYLGVVYDEDDASRYIEMGYTVYRIDQ